MYRLTVLVAFVVITLALVGCGSASVQTTLTSTAALATVTSMATTTTVAPTTTTTVDATAQTNEFLNTTVLPLMLRAANTIVWIGKGRADQPAQFLTPSGETDYKAFEAEAIAIEKAAEALIIPANSPVMSDLQSIQTHLAASAKSLWDAAVAGEGIANTDTVISALNAYSAAHKVADSEFSQAANALKHAQAMLQ